MKKSLFDFITENIASSSPKDLTIHECTLATELIESEKEGDPFALYDFLPQSYRGKNFILTRHLMRLLRNIVLFFIALCYAVYDVLHRFFIGKWKSKLLDDEVKARRIPDKEWVKRLHTEKWRGIQPSSGLNAIIFVITLINAIIALAWGYHFLIKEVMLSDNDCRVNHFGIVTIDQGCLEEQHFFLLNAATCWTSTGIAVNKGDKVYITASGSMYSDVDEMVEDAISNKRLLYPRSSFNMKYDKMENDADYCIYGRYPYDTVIKKNKPVFGSLLYQICDEVRGPKMYNDDKDSVAIRQINFGINKDNKFSDKRYCFKAKKSGILYFSFNDILLDEPMIRKIIERRVSSREIYKALTKNKPEPLRLNDSTMSRKLAQMVDPFIWFEDNMGEALINIRVEKDVWKMPMWFHKKLLVDFYRKMNSIFHMTENGFPIDVQRSGFLMEMLIFLLWFGIDGLISWWLKKSRKAGT